MDELIIEGRRVLNEEINSLIKIRDILDESFSKAVMMIAEAHKLVTFGVGKSGMIARKIAATFSSIGISAAYLDPVDALHGDIGFVQENDTAILISKSGSTEELVRILPHLRTRNATLISIVGNMKSHLARNCDISLNASVTNEACPYNLAPTSSALVALAIGDALAMSLIKYKNITLQDLSRLHPLGQIGRNLGLKVGDVMHTNSALPLINPDDKLINAVIEITNKKLGCVCVVNTSNMLLGIITDGDIRRILQRNLDIRQMKVSEAMTSNPLSVSNSANLGEALSLMEKRQSQISVLPVIDSNEQCIGVIRLHDIVLSGL